MMYILLLWGFWGGLGSLLVNVAGALGAEGFYRAPGAASHGAAQKARLPPKAPKPGKLEGICGHLSPNPGALLLCRFENEQN